MSGLRCAFLVAAIAGLADTPSQWALGQTLHQDVEWPGYGGNSDEQHYSPLDQIDFTTVGGLKLAWWQDLPLGAALTQPIEAAGKVFTATGYSIVSAFDARTGKLLWRYDPEAPLHAGDKLRATYGSRGLAFSAGRLYVATVDGRLLSLDAQQGTLVWTAQVTEPGDMRFISGAPRVFGNKVVIGHGGSDNSDARGYLSCFDTLTGKLIWRFFLVPGDPALGPDHAASDSVMPIAAKTWYGEWWARGGGGATPWNAISYDRELHRLYFGTGNGFTYNRSIRSEGKGDNLFVASIVAVNADTGHYLWHYQVNPGDEWDYDATDDLTLATLTIHGQPRKVVMQASKNGFFYVIDRVSGKLISAQPYAKATWASSIDVKTGRPVENPKARYHGNGLVELWPSLSGAHNWLPQSFSPRTQLAFIPTLERGMIIGDTGIDITQWQRPEHEIANFGVTGDFFANLPGSRRSFLKAWDPVTQQLRWSRETPGDWPGGTLATGGNVVFQGRVDHQFVAYGALSGQVLWTFDARSPIVAPPITFSISGQQFVTVLTGSGGAGGGAFAAGTSQYGIDYYSMPRRVLTFALNVAVPPPDLPPAPLPMARVAPKDPTFQSNPALEQLGIMKFHTICASCHGGLAVSAGTAPDLRLSQVPLNRELFESIVRGGTLVQAGMPKFADFTPDDVEAIRQYVRARAHELPTSPQ